MSDRVQPCPKCGSGPSVYADHETHGMDYYTEAEIWCQNPECDLTPNPVTAPTTAEAIAIWNGGPRD